MMDESNGKRQSGGFFTGCGFGKDGETYVSERAPLTAVSEAALQGYCVGYMEAMGSWLWKQVGTELSDEYCARFDACAEALKAALGVEIGEKE